MEIKNKIILAPMAGITDYAFRKIAREFGADFCVSEMISARAMEFGDKKTATLAYARDDDTPYGIQIFGHDPSSLANAGYLLSRGLYNPENIDTPRGFLEPLPSLIDINMGCPVKKIVTSGDGSALLKNPQLCGEIVRAVASKSSVPVTVKIRAGWDKNSVNCVEVAKILEANGASAITIHARTREQMYEPYANWDYIKSVKRAVSIPVIGNGDIFCGKDAVEMMERTGVDSVMIGRGALGNPFIFEEIKAELEGKAYTPPTIFEKIEVARRHISYLTELKGEDVAIKEARKHISWYLKGVRFASEAKVKINSAISLDETNEILNELLKRQ